MNGGVKFKLSTEVNNPVSKVSEEILDCKTNWMLRKYVSFFFLLLFLLKTMLLKEAAFQKKK